MQDIDWFTDVVNSFAILASLSCYEMLWLYIRQKLIARHSAERISIKNMVSYDLLLFMLKIEASTGGTNSMPFLVFRPDHLRSTSGIFCGSGSFAVQFGDHFRSGDHLQPGIICGAVRNWLIETPLICLLSLRFYFASDWWLDNRHVKIKSKCSRLFDFQIPCKQKRS